ncbi:MAG: hypothetical protein E6J90_35485 [Deltaproteobacteria bacterium]|nr:MAG: hypothetical protein E6J90_35485 [Deltaproteobacteria bacterium]
MTRAGSRLPAAGPPTACCRGARRSAKRTRPPDTRDRASLQDRGIGAALLLAGLAIASATGDDLGWLIGGAAAGAGLIYLLAAASCAALATCTAIERR